MSAQISLPEAAILPDFNPQDFFGYFQGEF
jgi:hypothetical protein